ncbi:MAG TPA: hypothetical protein VFW33_19525 [Gemmataceae bacterium]|nr:hypothetical protein [Gemmataceae bacterium]
MTKRSGPPLIGGPYPAPRLEEGAVVECQHKGAVRVGALSGSPIPWPLGHRPGQAGGGHWLPILTGALVEAVRTESAGAVAHWWGVSRATVQRWRKTLGVGRMTEGTRRIWVERASKLHKHRRKK